MPDQHQKIRCKARSKSTGKRCRCWAVNGSHVCRVHGAKGGRPPTHGLYSKRLKRELHEEIERLRNDPRLYDLEGQIAWDILLRDRAGHMLDCAEKELVQRAREGSLSEEEAARQEARMIALQGHISSLVDRAVSHIQRRHRIVHGQTMHISLGTIDQLLREVDATIHECLDEQQYERIMSLLEERLRKIPLPPAEGVL